MSNIFLSPPKTDDVNYRVEKVLRSYIEGTSPFYAILINSKWGSGKTTYIKRFIENISPSQKRSAYISLFGMNSRAELEGEIMRALHPILLSKGGKLIGKVAASALNYLKVPTSLSADDILDKFDSDIFVFDDIERCEMSIPDALGYINQFVEHEGRHVILLCDESKLLHKEEYIIRKEKLIGQTLKVVPPLSSALDSFIDGIGLDAIKDVMRKNDHVIADTFRESQCDNLRVLRQSIYTTEMVLNALSPQWIQKVEALPHLIQLIVVFCIETKLGTVDKSDVEQRSSRFSRSVIRQVNKDDSPLTPIEIAQAKYAGVDLGDQMLSNDLLANLLFDGYLDDQVLNNDLSKCRYFVGTASEPSWVTVWRFTERDEKSVLNAIDDMLKKVERGVYAYRGEILQVFGLLLNLSEAGQIADTKSEIFEKGKAYIDKFQSKIIVPHHGFDTIRFFDDSSYEGLGFACMETEQFQGLRSYLDQTLRDKAILSLPAQAMKVLSIMNESVDGFSRQIVFHHDTAVPYVDKEILNYIPVDEFLRVFLSKHPEEQKRILIFLQIRYEHRRLQSTFSNEFPWLIAFRTSLIRAADDLCPISRFRVKKIIGWTIDEIPEMKTFIHSRSDPDTAAETTDLSDT